MIFAEFYHESTGWNGKDFSGPVKLIPACGDRSIVIIDGRLTRDSQIAIARESAKSRGFKGFTLNRGKTFTRSTSIRPLESID